MEWKIEALPKKTFNALNILSKESWLTENSWYLAGGTALALQVGHRQSVDLDFFTRKKFVPDDVISHFSPDIWRPDIVEENTIYGTIKGAKVSFISYSFFVPVLPKLKYGSVEVLDKDDIAVMKIIAISQRGKKRDFIDLYWYATHSNLSLEEVIRKLPKQYPTVAHDFHHIIKSLTYFKDAEQDKMPALFFHATWKEIKKYFETEVPRIAKKIIGLE